MEKNMSKNIEIDFKELERLSQFGGSDREASTRAVPISPIVYAENLRCQHEGLSAVSAVTTLFSCNRTCGC